MKRVIEWPPIAFTVVSTVVTIQSALVVLGVTGVVRIFTGFVFLSFLPGFSLLLAVYRPFREQYSIAERVALSFATSLAIEAVGGLMLNRFGLAVKPVPQLLTIGIFSLTMTSIGTVRGYSKITGSSRRDLTLTGFLIMALALGLGISSILVGPRGQSATVSLYVVGVDGEASQYPRSVKKEEPVKVTVGVDNDYDSTRSFDLVDPTGKATRITLEPGQSWTANEVVVPSTTGPQELSWNLISTDKAPVVRRSVHIWLTVT